MSEPFIGEIRILAATLPLVAGPSARGSYYRLLRIRHCSQFWVQPMVVTVVRHLPCRTCRAVRRCIRGEVLV